MARIRSLDLDDHVKPELIVHMALVVRFVGHHVSSESMSWGGAHVMCLITAILGCTGQTGLEAKSGAASKKPDD